MKKLAIFTASIWLLAQSAYAGIGDNNSTNQSQSQVAKGGSGGEAEQNQEQSQSQGQSSSQGNSQSSTSSTSTKYFVPAPTSPQVGTDSINAASPLFNAGVSTTKKFIVLQEEYRLIQMAANDGYITKEEAQIRVNRLLDLFSAESRRKKVLWIPKTESICDNSIVGAVPVLCE